ncbi:integrase core domain-containing protein [Streptomyces sp. NPDC057433]|uniref:integrase core domain-containing protein n=1 Tax=Streptomyces sp. NPDC057433 TaxID=3346132 RepID=UPI003693A5A4
MIKVLRRPVESAQYTSHQFRSLLAELDIRQSLGRTGSCFDNAAAESFFALLKAEIGTTVWGSREEARQDVFQWIAQHYNRERIHSTIDRLHHAAPGQDPLPSTTGPRGTKRKCRDPRGHFTHTRPHDHHQQPDHRISTTAATPPQKTPRTTPHPQESHRQHTRRRPKELRTNHQLCRGTST